ncbi:cell envelope biogenesis protein OmpA [Pseudoruegeria sp. SK021]|nr:cell envelope biogenesis protein OmpA [Pseudoruegeria sp. SK021]
MSGFSVPAAAQTIGTVNFAFDSAELDDTARAEIAKIADKLKTIDSYKPTVVVGYTDAVGNSGYNLGLGQRRANAVATALTAQGVPVDRVGLVESRGETDLLVTVSTPERRNRRVNVTLEQMMTACNSYRTVPLSQSSIGNELQDDLQTRLINATTYFQQFQSDGLNTPAFQVAGATREACEIAVAYDMGAFRKLEYAQRCFCNAARLDVALGKIPPA